MEQIAIEEVPQLIGSIVYWNDPELSEAGLPETGILKGFFVCDPTQGNTTTIIPDTIAPLAPFRVQVVTDNPYLIRFYGSTVITISVQKVFKGR